jgi:hypothetical protein
MRNRLVIALALGVLTAVLAAGAVSAQVDGPGGITVDVPGAAGGAAGAVTETLPACSNTTDDDGDGLADLADPGCSGPTDGDEYDAPAAPTTPEPPSTTTEPPPSTTDPTVPEEGDDPTTTDPDAPESAPSGSGGGGQLETPDTDNPFGEGKGGKGKDGGDKEFGVKGGSTEDSREPMEEPAIRRPDGAPTDANPSVSITDFGAAPVGVPNFIIDQFSIPPFLLPIYQACGTQYGVPWEVLASINRIETAFGTNLNVSYAGALGWMQFIPSSWEAYGTDANGDGRKDPYNPVDAICAAARYLKAAGAEENLYDAIFAYNHADWYVDEVLLYAKQYGDLPSGLVDSLTGLTEGAHFPVAAKARYADDISERAALKRSTPKQGVAGNAADVISDSPTRRGINIYSAENAPVVAANDGVITKIGESKELGKFIVLRDAYGNEYTYAGLGAVSDLIPVPKQSDPSAKDFRLVTPGEGDEKPKIEASKTTLQPADLESEQKSDAKDSDGGGSGSGDRGRDTASGPINTEDMRQRLYAMPQRPANLDRAGLTGQLDSMLGEGVPGYETVKSYFSGVLQIGDKDTETRPLREGSQVVGGTVIGRVAPPDDGTASHLNFSIAPVGRGSKTIDPKPILDGWKLLEATAIYRAAGKNPLTDGASVGQVLLASKAQLQRQVLADPNIQIYDCGRDDVRSGLIDRRILAMLEYLSQRGLSPTVTSLACGRSSIYTASGNLSAHPTGDAVDIAQINGISILGNQGRGSITEATIQELLKLQGTNAPDQVISLMEMGGPTFALPDHADHIHVGYTPDGGTADAQPLSMLAPDQWDKLLDRIGELDQPTVPTKPSKYSLPAKKRSSNAHIGE